MKCIICATVEEPKEIETGYTNPHKRAEAEKAAREQAERIGRWEHVQVTITRAGGRIELFSGDVCPNEKLMPGRVGLTKS